VTGQYAGAPLTFDVRGAGGSFARIQRLTLYLYLGVDGMLAVSLAVLAVVTYGVALTRGASSVNVIALETVTGIVVFLLAFMALSTPGFSPEPRKSRSAIKEWFFATPVVRPIPWRGQIRETDFSSTTTAPIPGWFRILGPTPLSFRGADCRC
jgi:type IV secretory pathway VirB2 component (pilin)